MVANYFSYDYNVSCPGDTAEAITDMRTYYEFDLKIYNAGNPHITMEVLP